MKFPVIGSLVAFVLPCTTPAHTQLPSPPLTLPVASPSGKQFTIQAVVAGTKRTFLFDTGEGLTMISPGLAKDAKCEPWGNVVAFRMLGERLDTPRCDDISFELGARTFVAPTAIVYDLAKVDSSMAGIDGAIGLDLFAGQIITIRFATRQVVVESPASAAQRIRQGTEVPIRLSRPSEGAALDVNIGVDTPRGRAWMELDSGNAGPTIFVSPGIAPLLGLRTDTREAQPVTLQMAPGVVFTGRARVFPDMIMDGNIGMQFLGDRDLTLDLRQGRAWVAKPGTKEPGGQPVNDNHRDRTR
jgi:hypothetical protein